MTLYAYFDHTLDDPSPVLGWYDTDNSFGIDYPNLPDVLDLFELTPDQWNARMDESWGVNGGTTLVTCPPRVPGL